MKVLGLLQDRKLKFRMYAKDTFQCIWQFLCENLKWWDSHLWLIWHGMTHLNFEVSRELTVSPLVRSLESRQQQPPALGTD